MWCNFKMSSELEVHECVLYIYSVTVAVRDMYLTVIVWREEVRKEAYFLLQAELLSKSNDCDCPYWTVLAALQG